MAVLIKIVQVLAIALLLWWAAKHLLGKHARQEVHSAVRLTAAVFLGAAAIALAVRLLSVF